MTTLSFPSRRRLRRAARGHLFAVVLSCLVAAGAIGLVTYLLWPTWGTASINDPSKLPITVGGELFNVAPAAIRVKVQRRSGPQERIDLDFLYPSLDPPAPRRRVSAETLDVQADVFDRIFLSISAATDAMSPDERARTIYPRYVDPNVTSARDGLTMSAFREGSPYATEDLFTAEDPAFVARCMRDAATPGMCLSERRIGNADLVFRFPRSWLANWRNVATAMDRLTQQLHSPGH